MSRRSVRIYGGVEPDTDDQIACVSNSNLHVTLGDSASVDAFNRLRISSESTLLNSIHKYDKLPTLWYDKLVGGDGATSVHDFDTSAVQLSVTGKNEKVTRQTRQYFSYQSGKSHLIMLTFNLQPAGALTNTERCVGYFDDENGIFLKLTDSGLFIVKRSSTSGSPVDVEIEQANWNLSTLPDLDVTMNQILVIDLQWLGTGRVRVGFDIDGTFIYVHEFLHANSESTVYMTTAQLPVRYEIEAVGTPTGAARMDQVCSTVITEGGVITEVGLPHAVSSGAPTGSAGTLIPLLSVRPKATVSGEVNRRQFTIKGLEVLNTGNGTAEVHIIWDGTLTGATFASVEADSALEFDTAATAIVGGHQVETFYVDATNQVSQTGQTLLLGTLILSLDIDGANPTPLTVAITNHGTVTAAASLSWQET